MVGEAAKKDVRHDVYSTLEKDSTLITIRNPLPVCYGALTSKRLAEDANLIVTSKANVKEKIYNQALNSMRWRLDDEQKFETNSKLIQWDDGSFGVYVGKNYFEIKGEDIDNEMQYCVQDDIVMVSQQVVKHSGEQRDPIDNIEVKVKKALPVTYEEYEKKEENMRDF